MSNAMKSRASLLPWRQEPPPAISVPSTAAAGDHHGAEAGASSSPWLPQSPAHLRPGADHPRPPPHWLAASGAPMAAHRRLT